MLNEIPQSLESLAVKNSQNLPPPKHLGNLASLSLNYSPVEYRLQKNLLHLRELSFTVVKGSTQFKLTNLPSLVILRIGLQKLRLKSGIPKGKCVQLTN